MTKLLDIFTEFATDEYLENSGAWHTVNGGARLLVARAGNRQYAKALTAAVERDRKILDAEDDAADARSETIMVDVLADTVLLGWEGVAFKGEELSYSAANARKLLKIRDFRRLVTQLSEDSAAYKAKLEVVQGEA